ncbi:MAG: hypothetical protein HY236_14165 [Acidobacteria bacterium]|nr:hypothetical protein [Acidobacteriota bacterium]
MRQLLLLLTLLAAPAFPLLAAPPDYREAALEAARWVQSAAISTKDGAVWPADPHDKSTVNNTLYAGTPGVVLFLLEAHRQTRDAAHLKMARAGADALLAALPGEKETGLYEGMAGMAFALEETYKLTKEAKYRQGVLRSIELLRQRAVKKGAGIEWNGVTDIIAGASGTGLFLIYAASELNDPSLIDLAAQAGRRLIELGKPEAGGKKWAMDDKFPRLMPNFSHGTAGVAYFLATLYRETKNKEFLEAALAGGRYLQSVANTEGDGCKIFHNEPDGKNLYYLSWCHGPPGTARLFYRLWLVTGDQAWMAWMKKSAKAVMDSGIPEKETPGFWNNVGQCCGSTGVAAFFLSLYRVTGNRPYLDYSRRITAQLLAKATRDKSGMRWIQAEHRIKPDLLIAQTGYMQGAAGVGMWLLEMDAFERGKKTGITLPDSPF